MRAIHSAALLAALAGAALGAAAGTARAADSCIDCHSKAVLPLDREHDYALWEKSAHAKAGVSCHSCHGGDPSRTGPNAHKGILSSSNASSPIYFTKIPETCGGCHSQEFAAFRKSLHHRELMRSGKGPNCVTCHGSMANTIMTPQQLETTCSLCHRKPTGARPALMALNNASAAVDRLGSLLARAPAEDERTKSAQKDFARLKSVRAELQGDWHTFELKGALKKAQDLTKRVMDAIHALSPAPADKKP